MEELEFIMHKSQKRSTAFDDLHRRITEESSDRKRLEITQTQEIEILKSQQKKDSSEMQRYNKELERYGDKLSDQKEDLLKYYETILSIKQELKKDLSEIQDNIQDQVNDMQRQ